MNLTRTAITAGIAALSLTASASPALAKGGVDGVNNTVVTFISPSLPAPSVNSGGNGGGRPATCRAVGVDPVTGSILMSCTQARA
jgi:hypothetical protein